MTVTYPDELAVLVPYLRRFGRSTVLGTRRVIEEAATPEEVDQLVELALGLLSDEAAGVQRAWAFADELEMRGQADQATLLRAFIDAIMPVAG